jgi:hypothetical protein
MSIRRSLEAPHLLDEEPHAAIWTLQFVHLEEFERMFLNSHEKVHHRNFDPRGVIASLCGYGESLGEDVLSAQVTSHK